MSEQTEAVPNESDLMGLAFRRQFKELQRSAIYTEYGTIGLEITGGRVHDSRLQNFKGTSRAKVIREMSETDAVVKGLLSQYTHLGRAAETTVSPGGDTETDIFAAEFVQECLDDMEITWGDTITSIFSMLPHGFSWHEMNFKDRRGSDPGMETITDPVTGQDRIVELPPSKYDDGRVGWSGWPIRLQQTIDRYKFTPEGRVELVYQRPRTFNTQEREMPVEKLLHFRTTAKNGNPEGESLLESAYRAWYFKRNFEELLGIGVKRDLTGLLTLAVPKDWNIWTAAGASKRRELEDLVANLQRGEFEGLVHPDNCIPKLLQSGGQRQFDIMALVKSLWLEIAIATLTDFVLVGHEAIGARSLREEAGKPFRIALQGFLDSIAETINRTAIPPLIRFNGFNVTAMPKLSFSTVDVPEIDTILTSLEKLTKMGAEVFPNKELTQAIFGQLRLPTGELEENLDARAEADDAIEKAERMERETIDVEPDETEAAPADGATDEQATPDISLNGAQVKALLDIVNQVADGQIPRDTGVELIVTSFNIDRAQADNLMGEVGRGFKPEKGAVPPALARNAGIQPGGQGEDDEETEDEDDDVFP